jgi:hypothetical protein
MFRERAPRVKPRLAGCRSSGRSAGGGSAPATAGEVARSAVGGPIQALLLTLSPWFQAFMKWIDLTPQVVTTRSHKAIFREIFSVQPESSGRATPAAEEQPAGSGALKARSG